MTDNVGDVFTADLRKNECRKYFLENGVIPKFYDIFGKMMKDKIKPANPIDFIREELGDTITSDDEVQKLENELCDSYREINRLKKILHKIGGNDKEYEYISTKEDFKMFENLEDVKHPLHNSQKVNGA